MSYRRDSVIISEEDLKGNKKNLQLDAYKSKVRFHAMAMIMGKSFDKKKYEGNFLTAQLFKIVTTMSLKNVKLVKSLVNTCESKTAITVVDGKIYSRKYTYELNDMFNYLEEKMKKLKLGENKDKYIESSLS